MAISCFDQGLKFLGIRFHATAELRTKLFRKEKYDSQEIQDALEKLTRLGFLNDSQFAYDFCQEKLRASSPFGPMKLKYELKKRGISEEIISESFLELDLMESEFENALKCAEKKWKTYKRVPELQKKKEKLYRFLASRGYSGNIIHQTLEKILESNLLYIIFIGFLY